MLTLSSLSTPLTACWNLASHSQPGIHDYAEGAKIVEGVTGEKVIVDQVRSIAATDDFINVITIPVMRCIALCDAVFTAIAIAAMRSITSWEDYFVNRHPTH